MNLQLKLFFCSPITTNNNPLLRIYYEKIVDITFRNSIIWGHSLGSDSTLPYQPVFFLMEGKLVPKKTLYLYHSKYWLILDNTSYIGEYQMIQPTSENHLLQRYKGKKTMNAAKICTRAHVAIMFPVTTFTSLMLASSSLFALESSSFCFVLPFSSLMFSFT